MFEEYRKLLSWGELKKLNSMFDELKELPISEQITFSVICTLKALCRWQVWVSLAFLVLCVYLGLKLGNILGLRIGFLNLGLIPACIIGGSAYGIVCAYEAKKILQQLLLKKNEREKA